MQQAWDDIRKTVIVGLNTAHNVLEKRLGMEVTPETITNYLEVVNRMPRFMTHRVEEPQTQVDSTARSLFQRT